MQNYIYYLFDLDRTLWDFDKNAKNAIFKLIDEHGLSASLQIEEKELFFKRYEEINQHLWNKYEAGEITKEYLRSTRFYTVFNNYLKGVYSTSPSITSGSGWSEEELQNFSIQFGEAYLNQMTHETELEPHAVQVLSALKEKGGKIAIITNGFKEVQIRKLRNSDILHYMDAVIISEEVGIHKPNPVIFKKALQAICPTGAYETNRVALKRSTLMIGDDFTNDIEGAQIFGIDQFYYNPHHKPCEGGPTYESDSLLDLLKTE